MWSSQNVRVTYHTAHLRGKLQCCNQRRWFHSLSKPWRPLAEFDHSFPHSHQPREKSKSFPRNCARVCVCSSGTFWRLRGCLKITLTHQGSEALKESAVTSLTWVSVEISLALGDYHSLPVQWRVKRAGWSERGRKREGKHTANT